MIRSERAAATEQLDTTDYRLDARERYWRRAERHEAGEQLAVLDCTWVEGAEPYLDPTAGL